ncbi:NAD(P)H-dependent oxidoreductase [Nocardioides panacisoli]|uniref:NAD(P)H-dependent oxidoreductase n=1 Tax=Nocardioides panacisoli TaxID=627624 RepID=UPI001C6279F6|nr:NAD(P)H-dependent oxidoreductase [Nocardioides panacisoli]QYJ05528.1 NAD(P)H-dependent oxidoreductase [Nocardioides panacisoli]
MSRLLIVHHSPTPGVTQLTDALVAGARDEEIEGVEVVVRSALDAASAEGAEEVLAADGYLIATPANFGYMSGALKHFFDTIFLHAGGSLGEDGAADGDGSTGKASRKPYGLLVHGRYDTTGAVRSVQSIIEALGWTQSAEVLSVLGDVGEGEESSAYELGATIAALLSN